ncbi:MAG TPA: hypothetical protein VHZ78_15405 [Rhizomicrobium sp.]|nr:hypothetical protein [Rhizomicrobium sp.]
MTTLFRQFFVWKWLSEREALRYCCFENLETGRFCVQNVDFIHLPPNETSLRQQERMIAELFIETSPLERAQWFDTVIAAIAAHDSDFSN